MIDIENKIINTIEPLLRAKYPNISIYSEYVEIPSSFPCVTIVEEDNFTYEKTQDIDGNIEHHARLNYAINVYSDKKTGKKAEAKSIMQIIDNELQKLLFTRTMLNPVPNIDRTIYRIIGKYRVVVSEGITDDDGNITYQLYRR